MRDCNEAIRTRRSIRAFTDGAVDPQDLKDILDAARHAPSGGNRQAWLFVVVRDRAVLRKTAEIISSGVDSLQALHPKASADEIRSMQTRYRKFSMFHSGAPMTVFVFCNPYVSKTMAMLEAEINFSMSCS